MITIKVHSCKFFKNERNSNEKYPYYCTNKLCPIKKCWSDGYSIKMVLCPLFEKTGEPYKILLDDKQELKEIKKDLFKTIRKRLKEDLKNYQSKIKKIGMIFDKINQKSLNDNFEIINND